MDLKRNKICRKRYLQGSEHTDQKRPTPKPKQGIKRAIPSSVSSRNYKYRRPNNPSQESQSIAGPSTMEVDNTTRPRRQGQLKTEPTGQLRGDLSGLNRRQQ
ncbi:hypothetical protein TNCV_909031 [Trichonephila clavipes]|nr:hypothetical protein TNCV_909031 [Trichonephila clavipes]